MPKKKYDVYELIGEILILIVMIKPMFQLSLLTGIAYLAAIVGSIKNGAIFKKRNMGRFIVGGTILSYAAGLMAPTLFADLKSGDYISFFIILIVAGSIWFRGFFLKKGIKIK